MLIGKGSTQNRTSINTIVDGEYQINNKPISLPCVSIVVPAYGNGQLLDNCLNSLRQQSMRNVEIIVINDASPDDTAEVIAAHVLKDSRIRLVYNQENMGLYETRLLGIQEAAGEYIVMCDADDDMPFDAIEKLYQTAMRTGADIIHGRTRYLKKNTLGGIAYVYDPFNVASSQAYVMAFLRNFRGWNVWGKLYRRATVMKALPLLPRGRKLFMAEDMLLSYIIGLYGKSYASTKSIVYHYRQSDGQYFCDPKHALSRMEDHLFILKFMRHMAIEHFKIKGLPRQIDLLIKHIAASIYRNIPPQLQMTAQECIREQFEEHTVLDRNKEGIFCRMVERLYLDGAHEIYIALRRFISASKKRGWRTVLKELNALC